MKTWQGMINWKGCGEGSAPGLILRYYPGILLNGPRKTTKNLSPDSLSPGRDLYPGPHEYEEGMLTTRI
jgi:hypothetical protein